MYYTTQITNRFQNYGVVLRNAAKNKIADLVVDDVEESTLADWHYCHIGNNPVPGYWMHGGSASKRLSSYAVLCNFPTVAYDCDSKM
eukprot:666992-Rhodomonas_salina.1